jgi:hypothetical protein
MLMREGKISGDVKRAWLSPEADALWQAKPGSIDGDKEVGDALPPVMNGSEPSKSEAPPSSGSPSGSTSAASSENQVDVPSPTGVPI